MTISAKNVFSCMKVVPRTEIWLDSVTQERRDRKNKINKLHPQNWCFNDGKLLANPKKEKKQTHKNWHFAVVKSEKFFV